VPSFPRPCRRAGRADPARPHAREGLHDLPPAGPARDLGDEAGRFLRHRDTGFDGEEKVVFGPDGWLWWSGRDLIEAMSPDGKRFRTLWHTRRSRGPTVLAADAKGNLYVQAK
jgi:hypothetical protein